MNRLEQKVTFEYEDDGQKITHEFDGAITIWDFQERIRTFLLAIGYHSSNVDGILIDLEEE